MRTCHEIMDCPEEAKKFCKSFNQQKSCWLFPDGCPCQLVLNCNCENCQLYEEHRKDLLNLSNLDIRKNKKKIKAFLAHIDPIIMPHVNNNSKLRPVEKRKKKILRQFAVDLLKNHRESQNRYLEKVIHDLCREICGNNRGMDWETKKLRQGESSPISSAFND